MRVSTGGNRAWLVALTTLLLTIAVMDGRAATEKIEPRIESINKSVAKADERITLEISGVSPRTYNNYDFEVIVGGYIAPPEPGSGPGLLIVRVPAQLTEAVVKPEVFVRFTPRVDPESVTEPPEPFILRYDADFSIEQSTPAEQLRLYYESLGTGGKIVFYYLIFMVIAGFSYPFLRRFQRRKQDQSTLNTATDSAASETDSTPADKKDKPVFTLARPSVPSDLVTVMAQGDGVAFAGAGISAQSGLPVWREMLMEVIDGLREKEEIEDDFANRLARLLNQGDVEDAADALFTTRGFELSLVLSLIQSTLDRYDANPSDAHRELAQLPLAALLTTNYDDLLEQTFSDREHVVVTPSRPNEGLDALSQGNFFLLRLSGVLREPEGIALSPKQHAEMLRESPAFSDLLDRIILSRTILFVGVSLDGIEEFFRGTSTSPNRTGQHFALVAAEDDSWEIKATTLKKLYGVEVMPFAYNDRAVAVTEFLHELGARVSEHRNQFEVTKTSRTAGGRSYLSRVELTNVGPFAELSIDLNDKWNLLLGDNGVGKSTILKGITVGLVGKAAQSWAGRIIKSGEEKATIVLRTNTNQAYKTTVTQQSDGTIVVDPGSLTAMAAEGWLALGFPALRSLSWERSRTEPSLGIGRPMAGDLLPLITDDPDPRLDGLKQQIAKLMGNRSNKMTSTGVSYDGLMQDLIRLFGDVLEDMPIEITDVDPNTDEITVRTADGEVPFESLSQGTTSLVAWTGVFLQRLYETASPNDKEPRQRYALVMIDELDAHMHPVWQNDIVRRLKSFFPNVQFLAATHSPLVVRGLDMECIKRFKRNDKGKVEVAEISDDMTMGRADQVLASELFGTDGFDAVTEEIIAEYHGLFRKVSREPHEEIRLQELEDALQFRIPVPEVTPRDRRASEVFTDLIEAQMKGALHDEEEDEETMKVMARGQERLRKSAEALLKELERNQEK